MKKMGGIPQDWADAVISTQSEYAIVSATHGLTCNAAADVTQSCVYMRHAVSSSSGSCVMSPPGRKRCSLSKKALQFFFFSREAALS